MTKATDIEILFVAAVRADDEVGRGSCSSIDECLTDEELLEMLRQRGADSPGAAVKIAKEHEEIHRCAAEDVQAEAF